MGASGPRSPPCQRVAAHSRPSRERTRSRPRPSSQATASTAGSSESTYPGTSRGSSSAGGGTRSPAPRSPGRTRSCHGTHFGANSAASPGSSTISSTVTVSDSGTRATVTAQYQPRYPSSCAANAWVATSCPSATSSPRTPRCSPTESSPTSTAAARASSTAPASRASGSGASGLVTGDIVAPPSSEHLQHGFYVGDVRQDGRVARSSDGQPRKRYTKSGHTSHQPRYVPPTAAAPPPVAPPPPAYVPPATPQHQSPSYAPPQQGPVDSFGAPTYHHVPHPSGQPPVPRSASTPGGAALLIGRSAVSGTNRAARAITRSVIRASKADGADESGLTALIWNQVLSYGTDAMITVALAGTVFFGASDNAKRGNVLLYLLITMAPFAVVAPVIGPALDQLQHGRRWTMAGTAIGRGILAVIMARYPTDLIVLYPCALGSLVLSKAYGVVRAAAAPRLVPPGLTLTAANARLSIFGLGSSIVAGGLIGVLIKVSGSYKLGLTVTAVAFAVCAFFAFRLPPQIDSAFESVPHPQEPDRPMSQQVVPPLLRLQTWARRGFPDHLIIALQ